MMSYRNSNALILSLLLLALWPATGLSQQPQTNQPQTNQPQTNQPLTENENPLLIGKRDINKQQINFYSAEKEIASGRQLAMELERQSRLLGEAGITDYLARLGRNLELHSDATIPVTIKVVDSEDVNALALPGGFLYVNLGLLRWVETEEELAAVLAHLIAHVAARHGSEMASKAEITRQAGTQPVVFAESQSGHMNLSSAEISVASIAFRRKAEAEADLLGAQYAWAAGYDPGGLFRFYEQRSQPAMGAVRILSPHPPSSERISKVKELIARFPEREKQTINTEEFDRVKARLPLESPKKPQLRRN